MSSGADGCAEKASVLVTSDLTEARAFLDPAFYRSSVELVERGADLAADLRVAYLGPLTISAATFGADLEIMFEQIDAYHVNVPVAGHLRRQQDRFGPAVATPATAAVYQPTDSFVRDRWSHDCRVYGVKIDRTALETRLAEMIGTPVRSPIGLCNELDVSRGAGRSWARLLRLLATDATEGSGLAHHPLIGESLQETLLTGLLLAADHPYHDHLLRPDHRQAAPRTVRAAVDAMHEFPDSPFTAAGLAEIANTSTRTLQEAFKRHIGIPPMRYLQDVRLAKAHQDLCETEPSETTVAAIAHRWGFTHLGRFADLYRRRYGVPPSRTLRSTPANAAKRRR